MATISMRGISNELSEEEIRDLEALEYREVVFDDDCPEMTEDMLRQFHRFDEIPLKIDSQNYSIVKSFGENGKDILSRLLNSVLQDKTIMAKFL